MGVSVSAATGIIFVSVILSFSIIWEAEENKDRIIEEARKDNVERNREQLETSVFIMDSSYWGAPQNFVSANLSNNGSNVIDLRYTDVYLNGTHYNKTYTVRSPIGESIDNTYIWAPREITDITVNFTALPLELPVRVKVCCPNGVSVYAIIT